MVACSTEPPKNRKRLFLNMAREGFGYVLGFDGLVYTGADSDLCFWPLEPALTSPMYIIWKKYQVLSPAAFLAT